jgi:endo-1,4-beta-xylanase
MLRWMRRASQFSVLMLLVLAAMLMFSLSSSTQPDTNTLRFLAQKRGIGIGTAVAIQPLTNNASYRGVLAREFNMLTPENVMKFEVIHPKRDRFDFKDADTLVAFAQKNHMQVRGHTLVWHRQLSDWLTKGEWTREELMSILRQHIDTVVGRYRGQLIAWDVVNEAIADDQTSLRNTIWWRTIGPEYLEMAFRWAHQADPQARLFYNDYDGEALGKKSDAIYALVKDLRQRDVPIHGVGLQMHVSINNPPNPKDVAANIKRLGELGLEVQITEMDVRIHGGTGTRTEKLAAQAQLYRNMLRVCLKSPNCKAFVTWGFTDRHSWIPSHFGHPDSPLFFDESFRPKPAYNALRELLQEG